MPWLWQGYLAPGQLTLLTGRPGLGLTTLTAVLLARLETGGALAGLPLAAARAVVITGDSPFQWAQRGQLLGIGKHVGYICQPFRTPPQPHEWQPLFDQIANVCAHSAFSLVVIDPLNAFLPGPSYDHATLLTTLATLRRLTALGLSVLALYHPRTDGRSPGQPSRDPGPSFRHADILIEMGWCRQTSPSDRRRRLRAWSRFEETPRHRVIERTPDGTNYLAHDSLRDQAETTNWRTLHALLAGAAAKLTRADIRQRWPTTPVPDEATIYRWLEEAVARGVVCKDGQGRRNHPFCYGLR
jgi:hypothetical protein